LADEIAEASSKLEGAKQSTIDAVEKFEKTKEYKEYQSMKRDEEELEGKIYSAKEMLLQRMKDEDEKNVQSGEYKIHTAEREGVNINDEEIVKKWLRDNNMYDSIVQKKEVFDKKALNSYVMELKNDRVLPEPEECGVEVSPNIYLVIKKGDVF